MAKKQSVKLSTFGSQFTTIISVSLVLLILGIIGMAGLLAHSSAADVKSKMGFIVKVQRDATPNQINDLNRKLIRSPFAAKTAYSSAEDILKQETRYLGKEELELLDINPYSPEFDIRVKPTYAVADSLDKIRTTLAADSTVEEVIVTGGIETVKNVNFFLDRAIWVLLGVAGALLLISFVLINNTVYLAVYARRFIIHTMRLVGATAGTIRRPFILAGCVSGLIAGGCACVMLTSSRVWLSTIDPIFENALPWPQMLMLMGAMILTGVVICAIASLLATTRYLRMNYDDMFMK